MGNAVVVLLLLLAVLGIVRYLRRAKSRGGCVGCPYAGQCGGREARGCGRREKES